MTLHTILKHVELFRGLNDDQLKQIVAISTEHTYEDGSLIFRAGSDGDALFVVQTGQVSVQATTPDGDDVPAVYLGEGQIFGEMALIDKGTRSASVRAVGDSTALRKITTSDFTTLCESNTEIGYVMMRNLAQDLSFKLRHQGLRPQDN